MLEFPKAVKAAIVDLKAAMVYSKVIEQSSPTRAKVVIKLASKDSIEQLAAKG